MNSRNPLLLSEMQAHDVLEHDVALAEIASVLSSLKDSALECDHLLVCSDSTGQILHLDGDATIRRRAEKMNFVVGSAWSETAAGTNAIGTAIATKSPVEVFASEHYCHRVHPWTCSAAPILDPACQEVLGVLDLTGPCEVYHPHTLAAVLSASKLVEERLRGRLSEERFRLLEYYLTESCRLPQTPIAVLDRGYRVVKASPLLYERGWIDAAGRFERFPVDVLNSREEASWEVHDRRGGGQLLAARCTSAGASGFIIYATPRVTSACATRASAHNSSTTRSISNEISSFEELIGDAPSFQRALSVARSAGSRIAVLIEGETGTGKELVARAVHNASSRRTGPFVVMNCAALPRDLAVTEFFGFEGGSFTGAAREGRQGKIEQANGGTIFLDEIGDMALDLQAILLRVLEDRTVVHVGGRKSIAIDVRIIAATNHDLPKAVERGEFRKDLYYRLNVLKVQLPPLRKRPEDLNRLLTYHLDQAFRLGGHHTQVPPRIDKSALDVLKAYSWPGNVRELRNLAERLVISGIMVVRASDLPNEFLSNDRISPTELSCTSPLKGRELEIIRSTVADCSGNISEAARRLGIDRSTIYRRLHS